MDLLLSTRNPHKTSEVEQILGGQFRVLDLSAAPGVPEVEETGSTFEENASLKAIAASMCYPGWVIADDSGLEVDALGGAPGVLSARYAGPGGDKGPNNALLLRNLEGASNRSARFRCTIVLARAGRKLAVFEGAVEGRIGFSPAGDGGFGYDPLFLPEGYEETFAQLSQETKNALSHRGRALEKLKNWRGFF